VAAHQIERIAMHMSPSCCYQGLEAHHTAAQGLRGRESQRLF
jgi:hypothetical protein